MTVLVDVAASHAPSASSAAPHGMRTRRRMTGKGAM